MERELYREVDPRNRDIRAGKWIRETGGREGHGTVEGGVRGRSWKEFPVLDGAE